MKTDTQIRVKTDTTTRLSELELVVKKFTGKKPTHDNMINTMADFYDKFKCLRDSNAIHDSITDIIAEGEFVECELCGTELSIWDDECSECGENTDSWNTYQYQREQINDICKVIGLFG